MRLNQVIALEKPAKNKAQKLLTDLHRRSAKANLYDGLTRTYQALDEDSTETQPEEHQKIQIKSTDALAQARSILEPLWNIIETKDSSNVRAQANILVEGETLLADVPVSYLIWLEKQLNDVHKLVESMPTLDPGIDWKWEDDRGCYASDATKTNRTKKVLHSKIMVEATKEHPAQVTPYQEDKVIGHYTLKRFSNRFTVARQEEILSRIDILKTAVLKAREEANELDVPGVSERSSKLLSFLFT